MEVQLEGGIPGIIERKFVSSSRPPEEINLRDLFKRGDQVHARILEVIPKDFLVRLTCRSVDLAVRASLQL